VANHLENTHKDKMTAKCSSDVEVLEPSLITLQLRQENNTLLQAVDVLTRAHAMLSEDLNLKNVEIAQLECHCNDLKLETADLTEKVNYMQLKLAECNKDSSHCAAHMSEMSAKCVSLRYKNSAAVDSIEEGLVQEKACNVACCQQDTAEIRAMLVALQQELKQKESEKVERKRQLKTLKKEVENLREIVTTRNGTVAEVLAAKEENDKTTAALQLHTECLTGEKAHLDQLVKVLEDKNSFLQKDLSLLTDNYEQAKLQNTELQLQVDQLGAREQTFSDQLSSLRLCGEQKDAIISQLKSEKEEISDSLAALNCKVEANAVERTADTRHISELKEQIRVLGDEMETLSVKKQTRVDDLKRCKDVIEQQKQSVTDAKHENEHCQNVISDFEVQSARWRDEKCILECRIKELENYVTRMEAEVEAGQKMQQVARTGINDLPFVNNSENVEVSNRDLNDTEEHHTLQKCELVHSLDAVDQKSEASETDKNVYSNCASVHSLCLEPDTAKPAEFHNLSINLQETCEQSETEKHAYNSVIDITKEVDGVMEDASLKAEQMSSENELEFDLLVEVNQVHPNEKSEKVNSQPVVPENGVSQLNEHSESALTGAPERVVACDSLSKNDVHVAGNIYFADCNNECNQNSATCCENSLAVSDMRESTISAVCVKSGSVNKRPSSVENMHSKDGAVILTRGPDIAVAEADTVGIRHDLDMQRNGKRKVIKRFTRLPRSSAASKHNNKQLPVCSSSVLSLHTQSPSSLDVKTYSVADAVIQLPDCRILPSNEQSANTVSEISSAVNFPASTGIVPASDPAVDVDSCEVAAACVVDERSAAKAESCKHLPVHEQLSCLQTISECVSQATNDRSHHNDDNRNSNLITESEFMDMQSVFVNNDSDNAGFIDPAPHPYNKRLNGDVNDDAKKLRLG